MEDNTFTFTARSTQNPDKTATFTLHNGSVSVQLGNAILQQLQGASSSFQAEEGINVSEWAKPIAAGAAQRLLQPFPLEDFDADTDGGTFHTTTWIRAGGKRLAPIKIAWDGVDNPAGAQAFTEAVSERKEKTELSHTSSTIFDYWISWVMAGVLGLVLLVSFWRLFSRILTRESREHSI